MLYRDFCELSRFIKKAEELLSPVAGQLTRMCSDAVSWIDSPFNFDPQAAYDNAAAARDRVQCVLYALKGARQCVYQEELRSADAPED